MTAAIAKAFAGKELEKFRGLQDRTCQSDFDRQVAETSDDLTEQPDLQKARASGPLSGCVGLLLFRFIVV